MHSKKKEANGWWLLAVSVVIICASIWQTQDNLGLLFEIKSLLQDIFGNVHIVFLSIIIEALPFVIMGVIGSSLLEAFVSPEVIRRFLPRGWIPGILIAGLIGIIFPFCECGLVPIVKN